MTCLTKLKWGEQSTCILLLYLITYVKGEQRFKGDSTSQPIVPTAYTANESIADFKNVHTSPKK